MKILQIIQKKQKRGAEIFTCQLSNHLIDLGHQIKIIAVYEGEDKLPFTGEIQSLKASRRNRFFDFSAWFKLHKKIMEFQPDLVQANAGDTLKYVVLSKKMFRWQVPIVSRNASEVGSYFRSFLQKRFNAFFYKNVDYIISVSSASEKDILKHFPFLMGKTTRIPVGLESTPSIEKKHLIPNGVSHIVHVGGFTFEKNHTGLLRIYEMVLKEKPSVHMHLLGDGPLRPAIEKQAGKMGLEPQVTFHGFVDNPLAFIKASDVLVLPSIIEGLPGVLLEAMYCKAPVVAYNVGGIPEIVNSETGTLIKKGDETEFSKAVLRTLENPGNSKIETAYDMVTEDYMNKEIAKEFVEVYKLIIR